MPSIAVAAATHQPASSHSPPATVPPQLLPGAPIALADLPLAIALQTRSGRTRFAIRLDPPELGRIDVRLDIDNRSNVMLRLVAERPETLDLLRRDAAHIERALQDAGLKTGDQTLQFSLHNHSDSGGGALPEPAHLLLLQDEASGPAPPQIYARPAGLGAGIDIRV
ncbi:MAG TPA: flagellar hook-length control protein FliK [Xanthobacteraceae bacterium]|nr:flagellar hook-length control protein FliK [Xanthobacteraceae bacterium]